MDKYPHSTIGELCNIVKGETGIASATPGKYPLVNTGAERKSCNTYQFDTEAVCIPLVSSTGHGKKTLNYVHYQCGKFALGSILAGVIPKEPQKLSAAFLHRYLQFYKDRKIVPLMKGAANVSLAIKDIAKIEIPLPPINEQKSFIELFNKLHDSSKKLDGELTIQSSYLILLRQTILQEAIEGKLTADWRKKHPELIRAGNHASKLLEKIKTEKERLIKEGKIRKEKPLAPITDDEKPFELPKGWVWSRLGAVIELSMGQSPDGITYNTIGKGVPLVNGPVEFGGMQPFEQSIAIKFTTQPTKMCKKGDLLLCVRGSTTGRTNLAGYDSCIGRGVAALRPIIIESGYLNYLILTYRYSFYDLGSGSTFPNISQPKINNFMIALPPLAEQQTIVEQVEKLMAMIDELEKQVTERKDKSERLMQSVLREAFEQ